MLYERIKNLRVDRDIKQEEMADYLNVKQTTYSKYELGIVNISVEMLIMLAKYYNVSIDYLVGLTDEKKPYKRK